MGERVTPPADAAKTGASRELWLRAASAVVLGAISLALTWSGLWPFAALVLAVALVVLWEWGGIVRQAPLDAFFGASAVMILAIVVLSAAGHAGAGLAVLVAAAVAMALFRRGTDGASAALGLLYAGSAVVALVWLRSSGEPHGLWAILMVLLVVWGADSGAFAAGRAIGGPKLWPRVSPNKTWAGLLGAVLVGGLAAWAFARLVTHGNALQAAWIGAALAVVSQCGDLLESAIKRRYGVKDASHLIPGHGGFMDRVDGLIFAAVAAALYARAVAPAEPAVALLSLR